MPFRYVGDGHYCYSDALSMVFGSASPGPSAIEVLTGSPFGMAIHQPPQIQVRGTELVYFAPARWTPEVGIDTSLSLLGWSCVHASGDPDAAVETLRQATPEEPVLAGPVEMGLLPHHPGLGRPIGADHYLTVIGCEGNTVLMHDPRGYPYATLPVDGLLTAWQSDTIYVPVESYTTRAKFRRSREVDLHTALRRSLPAAAQWLEGSESRAAAERLAEILEAGINTSQFFHLASYMLCGGARRLSDAAVLLGEIGLTEVAGIMDQQARLVGATQHPVVIGDRAAAAANFRKLAPMYDLLADAMSRAVG